MCPKKEENMRGMNIKNSQYVKKKLLEQSQSQGPLIVYALPKGQVSLV